jgi:hypothetical protein
MICTRILAPTKEMLAPVLAIPEDVTYSPETLASYAAFEKSVEEDKDYLEYWQRYSDEWYERMSDYKAEILYHSPEHIDWESDRSDAGELWWYRTPVGCFRELVSGDWELGDALAKTVNLFPSISKDELTKIKNLPALRHWKNQWGLESFAFLREMEAAIEAGEHQRRLEELAYFGLDHELSDEEHREISESYEDYL